MLKSIHYVPPLINDENYPFNLSWLKTQQTITFNQSLTFVVGDNGIGKSTLIQSIAIHNQLPQLTNEPYDSQEYLATSLLANQLKSYWTVKSKRGFYFRADDFLRFVRETKKLRDKMIYELKS